MFGNILSLKPYENVTVDGCSVLSVYITCALLAVPVVIELDVQLDTQAAMRWKQDIISNLDTTIAPTIPFLLLGNKQDKVSS